MVETIPGKQEEQKVAKPGPEATVSEQASQKLSAEALLARKPAAPICLPENKTAPICLPESKAAPICRPGNKPPDDANAPKPRLPGVDIENNPSGETAPKTPAERKAAETKYFKYEFENKNIQLDPFQKGEGPYQVLDRMNKEHRLNKAVPFTGERSEYWTDDQVVDAARRLSARDLHGSKQAYKVGEQTALWSEKDIDKRVKELVNLPRGVDVSHYDGNIDWQKVKDSGIEFAFLKATGAKRSGAVTVDETFEANRTNANAAGVKLGYYHFFRADVPVDQQVQTFAAAVGKVGSKSLPLVMDVEEDEVKPMWTTAPDGHAYTPQERVKLIHEFCDGVKQILGPKTPIALYTSGTFVRDYLNYDKSLAKYPLWDANWRVPQPSVPAPWSKPAVWQYVGDKGKVWGIDRAQGGVDLDMAYDRNFLRRRR